MVNFISGLKLRKHILTYKYRGFSAKEPVLPEI